MARYLQDSFSRGENPQPMYVKLLNPMTLSTLILTVDYEPILSSSDAQSSTPFELGTFQEYTRQYLPLLVEHSFETIIQQRFQPLEAELRNSLNIQDIIRTSLSELFKTWQERDLPARSQCLIQQDILTYSEEDPPTKIEGTMIDLARSPPDAPDSKLSSSLIASGDTFTQAQCSIDAPGKRSLDYPCVCFGNSILQFELFSPPDESIPIDLSPLNSSSQALQAKTDSSQTFQDYSQTFPGIITSTGSIGKGKEAEEDIVPYFPSRTSCSSCGGFL